MSEPDLPLTHTYPHTPPRYVGNPLHLFKTSTVSRPCSLLPTSETDYVSPLVSFSLGRTWRPAETYKDLANHTRRLHPPTGMVRVNTSDNTLNQRPRTQQIPWEQQLWRLLAPKQTPTSSLRWLYVTFMLKKPIWVISWMERCIGLQRLQRELEMWKTKLTSGSICAYACTMGAFMRRGDNYFSAWHINKEGKRFWAQG